MIQPHLLTQAPESLRDPLGFNVDTASVSLFVLKNRSSYRTEDFDYPGFGIIDVLMCFQTQELAEETKEESSEVIKEVHFDEALDLAKGAGAKAALIIERVKKGTPEGRVVFVA